MLIIIGKKELEKIMAAFLTEARALIEKIAAGNGSDNETKQAVQELQRKFDENVELDTEQSTAILELLQKLANSEPSTGEDTTAGA